MLLDDLPQCQICHTAIDASQKWEYASIDALVLGASEAVKARKVHRACVTKLAGEVADLMGNVPENQQ